jgi:hypothetical protein
MADIANLGDALGWVFPLAATGLGFLFCLVMARRGSLSYCTIGWCRPDAGVPPARSAPPPPSRAHSVGPALPPYDARRSSPRPFVPHYPELWF